MTLNRFKQVCEDYGLDVEINQHTKNESGEYIYARAFFKNELVVVFNQRKILCYNHPTLFRYASNNMLIDNGEGMEIYSTSELEENIVQTIGKLKKLFIKIKKCEIEREFE